MRLLSICSFGATPAAAHRTGIGRLFPIGNQHTVTSISCQEVEFAPDGKSRSPATQNGSLFKLPEIAARVERCSRKWEISYERYGQSESVFGADSLPCATGFDDAYKLCKAQKPGGRSCCCPAVASSCCSKGVAATRHLREKGRALRHRKVLNGAPTTCTRRSRNRSAAIADHQAAELSQALATGAVDSFMSSGATGVDSKVWETLTHFHPVDAWLPKNMVIINLKEFEKLDKPTQAALLKAAADAERKGWERMRGYTSGGARICEEPR